MHAITKMTLPDGNLATIFQMANLVWHYFANTYAVNLENNKMYDITVKSWIDVPEKSSLKPFALETPVAASHRDEVIICDSRANSALPTARATPYNETWNKARSP